MIDQALQKLIEFIENASPVLWRILLRQTYVEAIAGLVWAVGVAIGCILLIKLARYAKKNINGELEGFHWMIYFFSSMAGMLSFYLLVTSIKVFANPEYYAIVNILAKLKGE